MTVEQIQESVTVLCTLEPAAIRKALSTDVQLNNTRTMALRDFVAQSLIKISRSPYATKETRTEALRVAKLYVNDAPETTDVEEI